MSDPQPHDVIREGGRWFPVVVIVGILASAALFLIVIASQHIWLFAAKQAVRNGAVVGAMQASASASVNRNSFNYNQGYSDILDSAWQTMHSDQEALGQEPAGAQADTKTAVLSDGQAVCYNYAQINQAIIPVSPSIIAWVKVNCDGTDVAMTSSLRK